MRKLFLQFSWQLFFSHLSGSTYILVNYRIANVFYGPATTNFCV